VAGRSVLQGAWSGLLACRRTILRRLRGQRVLLPLVVRDREEAGPEAAGGDPAISALPEAVVIVETTPLQEERHGAGMRQHRLRGRRPGPCRETVDGTHGIDPRGEFGGVSGGKPGFGEDEQHFLGRGGSPAHVGGGGQPAALVDVLGRSRIRQTGDGIDQLDAGDAVERAGAGGGDVHVARAGADFETGIHLATRGEPAAVVLCDDVEAIAEAVGSHRGECGGGIGVGARVIDERVGRERPRRAQRAPDGPRPLGPRAHAQHAGLERRVVERLGDGEALAEVRRGGVEHDAHVRLADRCAVGRNSTAS